MRRKTLKLRRKPLKMRKHIKRGGLKIKNPFTKKKISPIKIEKYPLKRFFSNNYKIEYIDKIYYANIPNVNCIVLFNEDQIISILQGSLNETGGVGIEKILYSHDDDANDKYAQNMVETFYDINNLTAPAFESGLKDLINHYK